ncbi:unnamed protein product [Prorocentrum cordatum]|uniref:Uncharacterized protein n=1 Tax=Prorocentrum cordatum TaxID=2364126 RepID=A0ABN9QLE9_9DINO|nr:unnamed protein product [Polarella glacialis]
MRMRTEDKTNPSGLRAGRVAMPAPPSPRLPQEIRPGTHPGQLLEPSAAVATRASRSAPTHLPEDHADDAVVAWSVGAPTTAPAPGTRARATVHLWPGAPRPAHPLEAARGTVKRRREGERGERRARRGREARTERAAALTSS